MYIVIVQIDNYGEHESRPVGIVKTEEDETFQKMMWQDESLINCI